MVCTRTWQGCSVSGCGCGVGHPNPYCTRAEPYQGWLTRGQSSTDAKASQEPRVCHPVGGLGTHFFLRDLDPFGLSPGFLCRFPIFDLAFNVAAAALELVFGYITGFLMIV
jgi:hypothetical protein